jgi:hypothetical protein
VFVEWLKIEGFHAESEKRWHESHVVRNPPARCGGLTDFWKSAR